MPSKPGSIPQLPPAFGALKQEIEGQRHFYDPGSKHIRYGGGAGIHLHRSLRMGSDETRAETAEEVRDRRRGGAEHIYHTIAADLGIEAANSVFLTIKGDSFRDAINPDGTFKDGQNLTLAEFAKAGKEVAAIYQGRSGAVLNGTPQSRADAPRTDFEAAPSAGYSEQFNAQLTNHINAGYRAATPPAGGYPENQYAPQMLREMGTATYTFNDLILSSPHSEETGFPRDHDEESRRVKAAIVTQKLLAQTNVREEDILALSQILNRDIFIALEGLAEEQPGPDGTRLSYSAQDDPKGLRIHVSPGGLYPGQYIFSASLKQPLHRISNSDAPHKADRLDPQNSYLRMEIRGTIDLLNSPYDPVAVTNSFAEYAGTATDKRPTADV
jgi:hypothetical protein